MRRHAVILGASGSGKTETSMRIAHEVASKSEAQVFYLDAKGDRGSAERFCALMGAAGRAVRVFPNEPFDAWRGDWHGIANRLLEVIQFASEGPAAYYRDIAKTALQLACNHPDGPPRSSAELLARLDYELLLNAHGPSTAVLSLPRDKVSQVRLRYQAFFGQLGRALDGDWSWRTPTPPTCCSTRLPWGRTPRGGEPALRRLRPLLQPAQGARALLPALRR